MDYVGGLADMVARLCLVGCEAQVLMEGRGWVNLCTLCFECDLTLVWRCCEGGLVQIWAAM